jgi:hypothetical protein
MPHVQYKRIDASTKWMPSSKSEIDMVKVQQTPSSRGSTSSKYNNIASRCSNNLHTCGSKENKRVVPSKCSNQMLKKPHTCEIESKR